MASLASELIGIYDGDPLRNNILRPHLMGAGRFEISMSVMEAAMRYPAPTSPNADYTRMMLDQVRLPFPDTWMEFLLPAERRLMCERLGVLVQASPPEPGDFGWTRDGLIIVVAGRFLVNPVSGERHARPTAAYFPMTVVLPGDNGEPHFMGKDSIPEETPVVGGMTTREFVSGTVLGIMDLSLRTLALMCTRNAPIEIGEAEDVTKLNKVRAKSGKTPVLPCRPVRWSLSRIERRTGRTLSEGERREAQAHLCRGHVKIRKTGSFWWSPHYRGVGPRPTAGRDYIVEE